METQTTQVADSSEQSDERRASLLEEWLFAYEQAGIRPKLMPLGEDKEPIIKGRCTLDSEEAHKLLCDGSEAVERMKKGEEGFAIYAGKPSHNTERVAFSDHDDPKAFPVPTGEPTLLVATRRGFHEHHLNDTDDPIRNAKVGDGEGEIRAYNQYVLVPGSIHPSGFVYEVEQNRPIQTITDTELEDKHRPSAVDTTPDTQPIETDFEGVKVLDDFDIERLGETINGLGIEGPVSNPGIRLKNALRSKKGNRIQSLWTGHYGQAGYPDDRSEAECALVRYLGFWFGGDWNTVATLMDVSCRQYPDTDHDDPRKWANRGTDYRDSLKSYVEGPTKNMRGSIVTHEDNRRDSSTVIRRCVYNVTKALGIATRKEIMAYDADEESQWDETDTKKSSVKNALNYLEDEGLLFWYRSGRHTYYFTSPVQISKDRLDELDIERQDLIDQWRRQTE